MAKSVKKADPQTAPKAAQKAARAVTTPEQKSAPKEPLAEPNELEKPASVKGSRKSVAPKATSAQIEVESGKATTRRKAGDKTADPEGRKSARKATSKREEAAAGGGRKPNAAFMAPQTPTGALAELIGNTPIPRTEIIKKLWEYIKEHDLQDKNNRRQINADEKLRPLFGKEQISMFEVAKVIGNFIS